MISNEQIAAGRILLRVTQKDIANVLQVSPALIGFAELNKCRSSRARERMIAYLESRGVEFIDGGVRRKLAA